jgi:Tfp pilus assembly protein PilV
MRTNTSQAGFSIVETLVVVVVLVALGFVGYKVYNRQHATTSTASQSTGSATANDVAAAPDVKTTSDLDKAATTLDQTDPGSSTSDSSQLSDSF